jgi:hypothetical protein
MPTEPEASPVKKTKAPVSSPLGLHIYLYLLVAISLLSIACLLGAAAMLIDSDAEWDRYIVLGAPAAFLAVLWFALGGGQCRNSRACGDSFVSPLTCLSGSVGGCVGAGVQTGR